MNYNNIILYLFLLLTGIAYDYGTVFNKEDLEHIKEELIMARKEAVLIRKEMALAKEEAVRMKEEAVRAKQAADMARGQALQMKEAVKSQ